MTKQSTIKDPNTSNNITKLIEQEEIRKLQHSAIEKKRRQRFQEALLRLKGSIPLCMAKEKIDILNSGISYIHSLQKENEQLKTALYQLQGHPYNVNPKSAISQTAPTVSLRSAAESISPTIHHFKSLSQSSLINLLPSYKPPYERLSKSTPPIPKRSPSIISTTSTSTAADKMKINNLLNE